MSNIFHFPESALENFASVWTEKYATTSPHHPPERQQQSAIRIASWLFLHFQATHQRRKQQQHPEWGHEWNKRRENGDRFVWITLLSQLYSLYTYRIQYLYVTNITNLFYAASCTHESCRDRKQLSLKYQVHRIHNLYKKKVSNLMFFAWSANVYEKEAKGMKKRCRAEKRAGSTGWNLHCVEGIAFSTSVDKLKRRKCWIY